MLKKYCQPISTRPERMMARIVFRLSVIFSLVILDRLRRAAWLDGRGVAAPDRDPRASRKTPASGRRGGRLAHNRCVASAKWRAAVLPIHEGGAGYDCARWRCRFSW